MTVRFAQWVIDVHDVDRMAEFWSQALDYRVVKGDDSGAVLLPPDDAPRDVPTVWLQLVPEGKRGKNRNHPDLRPLDGDVDAEVERLVALGARPTDVGQSPEEPFVVLADPEGNEFCLLRLEPRRPGR